jgi:hypothetical protein
MCTKPAISEDTGRDGGCERGARTGHCPRTTRVDGISLATWTVGSQSHGLPPPPLASARPGSVPAGLRAPLACVRCPPPRSRHPAPGPPKRDVPGGAAPTSSVLRSLLTDQRMDMDLPDELPAPPYPCGQNAAAALCARSGACDYPDCSS